MARSLTVMKIGGELLESPGDLRTSVARVQEAAAGPLVIVHGGGRELSAELARRGGTPRMVDGIRVTDAPALEAAVRVLGGTINTRLVAALVAAGLRAVGLTGVGAALLESRRAPQLRSRSGELVDLGLVGVPVPSSDPALLRTLVAGGWLPVVASLGVTPGGEVLNVNADVAASHLAIALAAERLLVLGGTDGVLDASGATIASLTEGAAGALVRAGGARDGMAAKLEACVRAFAGGVPEVRIVNGRSPLAGPEAAPGTRIVGHDLVRMS